MWFLLIGLTWCHLAILGHVFTFNLQSIVYGLFLEPLWGNSAHMQCISQADHVFPVMNQTNLLQLMLRGRIRLPAVPAPRPAPVFVCLSLVFPLHPALLLASWARETAVFSHTPEERMNTKLWYLAGCQNNSEPHTCRLSASRDGKMTRVVFLARSPWRAQHWLRFSPSVHKSLDSSLEALRELSSFTTASNKQLPLEKVGFRAGHGLLPSLYWLSHTAPLPLPGALIQEFFLPLLSLLCICKHFSSAATLAS